MIWSWKKMLCHSRILQVGWGPIYLLKRAITRILQNVYSPPPYFLATVRSVQDLSSQTRDWTHAHAVKSQNLNHWTASKVPKYLLLNTCLISLIIFLCVFFPRDCFSCFLLWATLPIHGACHLSFRSEVVHRRWKILECHWRQPMSLDEERTLITKADPVTAPCS